jgi:tetratricopeptide (TPR) repeat protein
MIGDLPRSVRALELALTDLDPVRDPEETCYSTSFLALALAHQGEFERSLALQERALRLARAAGDHTYEASALVRLAISWVVKGDWQAAIDAARDTVGIAERGENPMIAGFAVFLEGQARFMLGDTAAGLAQCNRGLQIVEQSGSHLGFSLFLSALAELHALAGDHDRAIEIAGRALAQRRSGGHLGLYDAYRALALVAEHRAPGNLRLARSRLAYAHRLATAAGAWPAVAVGCLRQAEMLARHGKPDRARVALRKAIVYFESRGMRWWLDQAKRQDAELHARRDSSLAIPVTGLLPPRV